MIEYVKYVEPKIENKPNIVINLFNVRIYYNIIIMSIILYCIFVNFKNEDKFLIFILLLDSLFMNLIFFFLIIKRKNYKELK